MMRPISQKCLSALLAILAVPTFALAAKVCDGTGDGWTINNPNKGSTSYTIGCWINDSAWSEDGNIMNYAQGSARGFAWYEYPTPATYLVNMQASAYSGSTNNSSGVANSTWHSIIWTSSGGTVKWYLDATDGVADQTDSVTDAVAPNSTDDFNICLTYPAEIWSENIELSAKLEHCFYADAVLDDSEIASIANKTKCPTTIATHSANIQIFLPLTSGSAVTDESANHFAVTESGNPTDDAGPGSMPSCTVSSVFSGKMSALGAGK